MSLNVTNDDAKKEERHKYHVERREDGQPLPLHPNLGIEHAVTQFSTHKLAAGGHGILFGSRIPLHFFTVQGFGETDQGDGNDPWETGSYDLALEDAGIQDFNVQSYSSVIPPEATPVTYEQAKPFFRHGAVMEVIMAVMHGVKGDRITAGVGRMQIRRKSDSQLIGGYAAEYKGHANKKRARDILQLDLKSIFARRFDAEQYEYFDEDYTVLEHEVEKAFGTILASICFVTYVEPVYTNVQF